MAGDTVITVIGNLTDDPELRFTPSGAAVANFTVASTPRSFDRQTNEWKDGETLFLRCSVWRQAAENVAESLQKGMRVIVQGRLVSRSYEDREGQKRTVNELQVDEVGPSLTWATAKVTRANRSGGGGGYGGGGQQGGGQGGFGGNQGGYGNQGGGRPAGGDPWGSQPASGGSNTGGGAPAGDPWAAPGVSGGDEPPF
ncbi:single-strand binding protein [Nocardioides sp. J9]|uniref:single-stranded DNA-binding protein n=1 Tax=unclassified Nocardioides TaxID=2615069 RepID=UPI00049206D1|nr:MULTISPECIES: single-stranded DNA-binding protein [unclassified Nocardioides]TWG92652.1 single-strand binding protein [Nocardioides sp. J9]